MILLVSPETVKYPDWCISLNSCEIHATTVHFAKNIIEYGILVQLALSNDAHLCNIKSMN